MARVFITGSAGGLGREAARALLDGGYQVVIHARDRARLGAVRDLLDQGAAADTSSYAEIIVIPAVSAFH